MRKTFCFPFYVEKVENRAKLLETKMMLIGCDATEFGSLSIVRLPITTMRFYIGSF